VIELFEGKHTSDLSDRHAQSIIQLCQQMNNELNEQGFLYRELEQVAQVVDLIFHGLTNNKFELVPALGTLLEVLSIPFEKEKSSDELKEVPKMPLVFNGFCKLLEFEVPID